LIEESRIRQMAMRVDHRAARVPSATS
jgi:hypothetical protein